MSNQMPCPNCGGYKSNSELTQIDPKTGQKISSGCGSMFWGVVVLFVIAAYFGSTLDEATFMRGVSVVFPFMMVASIWFGIKGNQAKKRAYNLYNFHCQICGNRWEWREGTPYPKVKVDPELIAKGNQLLEEQQKQQDAAALNYLLNKDK
jgi:hypothetical protein